MTPVAAISLLALCVAIQAFFSGSEMAMVHANRNRLQVAADDGDVRAARALDLLSDESTLLATCLIGTNLCVVSGASLCAALLATWGIQDGWAVTAVFAPVALVFGEALPKTVMGWHADAVAPAVALPLQTFRSIVAPLLAVVRAWNRTLSKRLGRGGEGYLTRQEILDLLDAPQSTPFLPGERQLIRGVLSLSGASVSDCMTSLVHVVAVPRNTTVGHAARIALDEQHSRLPVYHRRIDHLVGIVHVADLLYLTDDSAPIATWVRPVRYVPGSKRAASLLTEMRAEGEHFAVVVDEYGGCVGIVTLEDMLEELVGDIEDERDTLEPDVIALSEGVWEVAGDVAVEIVRDRTGLDLPDGDYVTVAGWVLETLGRIPPVGEVVSAANGTMDITGADERRIQRLVVRVRPTEPTADS